MLEVGTLIGYSAILMAGNLPAGERVTSIEINPAAATQARANIRKAGLTARIKVITGNAARVIPALDGVFDMLFLDADKKGYLTYLKLAERMLKQGGVVFADNARVFAAEMAPYLRYLRSSSRYQSEFVDFGADGVEVSTLLSTSPLIKMA